MNKFVAIAAFSVLFLALLLTPQSSHAYYASSAPTANKYSSTISTGKKIYGSGEALQFSGTVKPYEVERKLMLVVKDAANNVILLKTVSVNSDGSYTFSVSDTSSWKKGTYSVAAQYGYSEVDIGTATFSFDPSVKTESVPSSDIKAEPKQEVKTKKDESKADTKKDMAKKVVKKALVKKSESKTSNIPAISPTAPVSTPTTATSDDSLQKKLDACKAKETPREQYECQKALKSGSGNSEFKSKATATKIGPVTFYYAGAKVEQSTGKDIVNLRFLVENTGSNENISMLCTGPIACNYDISDGTTTFKYAANDFTNGNIVLKPGDSRMMNMLFGPAIGYGSYIDFKFDQSKQYKFNVHEPWGSGSIPLNLK